MLAVGRHGMLSTAARAGLGLAPLPCFLGDAAAELQRLRPPVEELASELWLLTHRDLKRVARIRAFMHTTARELRRMSGKFAGNLPVDQP